MKGTREGWVSPPRKTERKARTVSAGAALALALLFLPVAPLPTPASSQESGERTVGRTPSTGALEITVTLGGSSIPSSTRVENSTDPAVCGTEHTLQDLVVSSDTRGIRYVIAALADVPEDRIPDRASNRLVIDNRDCRFVPHAAVATVGDTIVAVNSDSTLHNTHYYGPMQSNVALAVAGMSVSRIAGRPGLVSILCDVHGWMKAYLRIDPHPFHGVSDADGRVRIDAIPPGTYEIELWHERLGERVAEVEIEAGRVTTLEAEFPPPED